MKTISIGVFFLGVFLLTAGASAQGGKYVKETDTLVLRKLENWQERKFGLLMHWGTYSQWGVVESWSICSEDEGWCRRKTENYVEYKKNYENLKTTFNPVNFQPEKWAQAAQAAGMKYVVFTTKHHDGFCMFDTKFTDYKITDPGCPFSRDKRADVTAGIFRAFRQRGFMIGAYFSKPDWHSPYYWWPNFATPDRNVNYDIRAYPERWQKFVEYTQNQIGELMSNYGGVDILWLDGGWVSPMTEDEIRAEVNSPGYRFQHLQNQDIHMADIAARARALQPGLIIVDRAVPGPYQNYLTPEARVPEQPLPYPWETCMPMATSWSYVPNDTYKPVRELIHMLVDIVAKGGNFLLNIGPDSRGEFDPEAYDRLGKIGEWMSVNGEAIYGSHPVRPYRQANLCLTEGKDGTLYAIYLASDGENEPPTKIMLPGISPRDHSIVQLVGTEAVLSWEKTVQGAIVTLPENITKHPPCRYAWTLRIRPDGK
jgi:alpha-L-fucosidase